MVVTLTKENFKPLVMGMKSVFNDARFIPNNEAFDVWFEMLKDIPYAALMSGIQSYMMVGKYPPTIADIREEARRFMPKGSGVEMSDMEAWAIVDKAIAKSTYFAKREFANLPPLCQRVVGSPSNLRKWAQLPLETLETVIQSQFLKSFRAERERMAKAEQYSPVIQERIKAIESMVHGTLEISGLTEEEDDEEDFPYSQEEVEDMVSKARDRFMNGIDDYGMQKPEIEDKAEETIRAKLQAKKQPEVKMLEVFEIPDQMQAYADEHGINLREIPTETLKILAGYEDFEKQLDFIAEFQYPQARMKNGET